MHPLSAWTDLAVKTGEMLVGSAEVIARRTHRIARAGLTPNARDRREFSMMGMEKEEAATESAQAMIAHAYAEAIRHQQQMMGAWMRGAFSGNIAGLSVVTNGNAMMAGAVAIVHKGLRPIHSRAASNARRL